MDAQERCNYRVRRAQHNISMLPPENVSSYSSYRTPSEEWGRHFSGRFVDRVDEQEMHNRSKTCWPSLQDF